MSATTAARAPPGHSRQGSQQIGGLNKLRQEMLDEGGCSKILQALRITEARPHRAPECSGRFAARSGGVQTTVHSQRFRASCSNGW
ncbi:hypothetical protein IC231_14785 [Hymenobacter sp. BT646]|uniref:Uncharacterized protein n=1 Tax=Hymenobacter duratus TaxID=2771356 RepID=A0ABR8JJP2_9BACT|nr:hypothetical protein [Hymenobacter duratus]